MTKPAIMVVDDRPEGLEQLESALRRRYEHDYLIMSRTSPAAALDHLTELRSAGRPVAVVLAAATLAEQSGTGFLARVRGTQPAAKRVLIVPRGGPDAPSLRVPATLLHDRSAARPVLQAMALGMIDAYLTAPGTEPDEQFHGGISELLEEWAHDTARPSRRRGSSGTGSRPAPTRYAIFWPATASPMPSSRRTPNRAGPGWHEQNRTARNSRCWSCTPGRSLSTRPPND